MCYEQVDDLSLHVHNIQNTYVSDFLVCAVDGNRRGDKPLLTAYNFYTTQGLDTF